MANLMAEFEKYKGGTDVDSKDSAKDPETLKTELQESFDRIFPELVNKEKHRKHVIFDNDVFETFEFLSKNSGTPFSTLINTALRSFAKEKLSHLNSSDDPVAELLEVREKERELLKKIKELDLSKELSSKLG